MKDAPPCCYHPLPRHAARCPDRHGLAGGDQARRLFRRYPKLGRPRSRRWRHRRAVERQRQQRKDHAAPANEDHDYRDAAANPPFARFCAGARGCPSRTSPSGRFAVLSVVRRRLELTKNAINVPPQTSRRSRRCIVPISPAPATPLQQRSTAIGQQTDRGAEDQAECQPGDDDLYRADLT